MPNDNVPMFVLQILNAFKDTALLSLLLALKKFKEML